MLSVNFNYDNGGIDSITDTTDRHAMNWVEGKSTWGLVKDAEVVSVEKTDTGLKAVYKTKHMIIDVERVLDGGILTERYTFRSGIGCDIFMRRGETGIYATFNDSYDKASVCMTKRCHAHIWCGGEVSYVEARRMGPSENCLGLVLTKGSLDTYSVERDLSEWSNDRGDIILHPSPFDLRPSQTMTIEWKLFFCPDGKFYDTIADMPEVMLFDTDNYTVYQCEHIKFSVNRPDAEITLDGAKVPASHDGSATYVDYIPGRTGEHIFHVTSGGRTTKAEFFVHIPFEETARLRAEFIVRNQQYINPESALDGAYLIYDNEDKLKIFDNLNGDYNASRERLVMGLFIAKYLQYRPDDELLTSLLRYYRFITREFFDEETGEVYNTIGKDPTTKRLYNAPWMALMTLEMYKLTGDETYLDKMARLLKVYYTIGGERFYPNGLSMFETVDALRSAGKTEDAEEITELFRKHVTNIKNFGINYPEHEVRYEQTIVSPAAALNVEMFMITGEKEWLDEAEKHAGILERFNGRQPSYLLNNLALRHWDAFWFGKRRIFGDTFPHTASIHSSDALIQCAECSGDREMAKRAVMGARNCLCLFREDGSASCTRVHPLYVNGVRAEYYDEFANEQDGYLYFMIKYFGALDK